MPLMRLRFPLPMPAARSYHCIARWLKTRLVCPLDNKEWVYQKYGH